MATLALPAQRPKPAGLLPAVLVIAGAVIVISALSQLSFHGVQQPKELVETTTGAISECFMC